MPGYAIVNLLSLYDAVGGRVEGSKGRVPAAMSLGANRTSA